MDRAKLLEEIQQVVQQVLPRTVVQLSERSTAKDIPGWDSLSHMVLMAAIEKHFNLKFSFIEMINISDIGSMMDCIMEKLG